MLRQTLAKVSTYNTSPSHMTINLSDITTHDLCVAPWTNLHIGMNGGMKPCCFGKQDFGNVNDGKWDYFVEIALTSGHQGSI